MEAVNTNKTQPSETRRQMGKTRKDTPSRELVRLSWLIKQLEENGVGQQQLAELTGVKISYLNQLKNYDKYGKTGFGTDTLRQVMQGLRLSPSYFFDDYEGQQDHRLHLLSAKRDEKRVSAIEQALEKSERERAAQAVELAQLKADLAGIKSDMRRLIELNSRGAAARRKSS